MQAVIANHGPGSTKQDIADALKVEEVNRGLTFEYCLIAAGASHNRAPSEQRWEEGDVLSVDSGGNYHGYIGDLARMAILGEPDAELEDLLADIEGTQRAGFKPIKAGVMGGEIYASAESYLAKTKIHNHTHFLAHGMGLVSHEAPRLTATGPVPYDAYDATRPLETGMVVSVETTLMHPKRGFIKLEDTVVVTDTGLRHLRRRRTRLEPRRHGAGAIILDVIPGRAGRREPGIAYSAAVVRIPGSSLRSATGMTASATMSRWHRGHASD